MGPTLLLVAPMMIIAEDWEAYLTGWTKASGAERVVD
jgi:hypothetical protein